jgi:class 3 adenylate cyclase
MTSTDGQERTTSVRTFMIADVRGYSRFTAEHGDAAAAQLAQTFASFARDAVEARGGAVIELRGDEALAVFDVAAQAVRAALEFQATCAEEVTTDPSSPLLVGIGIAAGDAVPVEEGFRGAALNLAARLCSTAAAGEVLLSEMIADLAGEIEGISIQERGSVELKGFPRPTTYLEASPAAARSRIEPADPLAPRALPLELDVGLPLVGREHEMRWARGTWRQACRGVGRVVVVSGPTGIGKTRLAAEIAAHVQETGGTLRYAGAGGTAIADTLAAIDAGRTATSPTLVILDDLDAVGEQAASALAQAVDQIQRCPAMVLALVQRPDAVVSLAALVEVLDVRGDGHRLLGPLDADGVREICRIYAGEDVAEARSSRSPDPRVAYRAGFTRR